MMGRENMGIQILKTGITNLTTDALVNAANEGLWEGGGVCGIIFKAAGADQLQAACNAIGGCKTGSAVITPGFNLKSKYIIHAVGPRWQDGKHNEPKLLYSAYKQSLILAVKNNCKSVGFPLISAGIFGYPVDKAWRKALQACLDFQKANPDTELDIKFAVIDDSILSIGKKTLAELRKGKTSHYLKQLDEDGIQHIKQKMSRDYTKLFDQKAQPMASGLMKVICDPAVINNMSVDQLIQITDSIFPESVLDENWLPKYSDMLLRILDDVKKKKPEDRADRYEKYLRGVLITTLKAGVNPTNEYDLDTLEDVFKVSVCLYRYYTENETEFVFETNREQIEKLNEAVYKIKGVGNQLGLALLPVKNEERQYAFFLGWILEEILIKHECYEGRA